MPSKDKSGIHPEKKKNFGTRARKTSSKKDSPKKNTPTVPSDKDHPYVVGIGASAGGLDAMEKFFAQMPAGGNMAFVVVTHLDPSQVSILPELIQKKAQMPVLTIQDGMQVKPDTIFIVPPNWDVGIIAGTLQLIDPVEAHGQRLPIDFFLKNLAMDQKEKAVGVILSGMGSDGAQGLKFIKEELGMVMVQDPSTAKFDGMPRSALNTGLADYTLSPEKMPQQLSAYTQHTVPGIKAIIKTTPLEPKSTNVIQKILITLRNQTGHDFSQYKKNTVIRRVERRMNVHQIENLSHYFAYLQKNPDETEALFKDLLIGVTSFFRDPEAFEALQRIVLPRLFKDKPPDYTARVWIPGCSTGEEAYSIAIMLNEFMARHQLRFNMQIFATDLDSEAIDTARNGIFPINIAADVDKELLNRYFNKLDGVLQIRKEIREMIVFAPQNLIKDPPFTKLDMISCRNLLIYLDNELQQKIMPLFHYALHPGGILFLGTSETIGGFMDLFDMVEKKWKIYVRKESCHARHTFVQYPIQAPVMVEPVGRLPNTPSISHKQLIERVLLRDITPACVLVTEKGETLYIHGRTGKYLEPAQGEFRSNILDMAHKELRFELAAAIRKARKTGKEAVCQGVRIEDDGASRVIDLRVKPLQEPDARQGQLLIVFEDQKPPLKTETTDPADGAADSTVKSIQQIETELQFTRESLQTTVEELETSNEELKSTNEELQSTNEELQSANEELETSKEEQQSLNEELQTVNSELQKKIEELSRANNDMRNLLDSLEIPTVFLDNDLCIKRFTSHIHKIMNLIHSDIGRPIKDIVINLKDTELVPEARQVIQNLAFRQREVQTHDGRWFVMRILPYRTMENVIDGLVVTFIDIQAQKTAEESSRRLNLENQDARIYAESIIETLRESIVVLDSDINIISANKSFYRCFKVAPGDTIGRVLYDLGNRQWDIPELRELLEQIIPRDKTFEGFKVAHEFPVVGPKQMVLNARKIAFKGSRQEKILLAIEDVTERE